MTIRKMLVHDGKKHKDCSDCPLLEGCKAPCKQIEMLLRDGAYMGKPALTEEEYHMLSGLSKAVQTIFNGLDLSDLAVVQQFLENNACYTQTERLTGIKKGRTKRAVRSALKTCYRLSGFLRKRPSEG